MAGIMGMLTSFGLILIYDEKPVIGVPMVAIGITYLGHILWQ